MLAFSDHTCWSHVLVGGCRRREERERRGDAAWKKPHVPNDSLLREMKFHLLFWAKKQYNYIQRKIIPLGNKHLLALSPTTYSYLYFKATSVSTCLGAAARQGKIHEPERQRQSTAGEGGARPGQTSHKSCPTPCTEHLEAQHQTQTNSLNCCAFKSGFTHNSSVLS